MAGPNRRTLPSIGRMNGQQIQQVRQATSKGLSAAKKMEIGVAAQQLRNARRGVRR
jgi:hypothetical protein